MMITIIVQLTMIISMMIITKINNSGKENDKEKINKSPCMTTL